MGIYDSDFRTFMIELGRDFTESDVDQIGCWFGFNNDRFKDGVDLLKKLEDEGKISAKNVTQLIEPLKKTCNVILANRVREYQQKADSDPRTRDSTVFAGRSDELDELDFHIKDEETNSQFRAVFISGMPGVGKTLLAQEFMRRYSNDFKPKLNFMNCRGVKSLVDLISWLKEELRLQFSSRQPNYKAIERNLRTNEQSQLISFDNVEDVMEHQMEKFVEFLTKFVTHAKNVKTRRHCLLITSRRRLPEHVMKNLKPELLCLRLDEMTMDDSKTLLKKYLVDRHVEVEKLERLANICGRHPLSMALVANRLRLTKAIEVEMVESTMSKQPLATLRDIEELNPNTRSCIEGTFEQIFDCLKQSEQELLIGLATAPHDMSESVALEVTGRSKDRLEFELAIERLLEFNLVYSSVETDKKKKKLYRYSLHLLTRNFVLQYCQLDDCPADLRKQLKISKDRLIDEYVKNMKSLSITEFVNPKLFAMTIKKERLNYLSSMGEIYNLLIERKSSYDEFCNVDDVMYKILYSTQDHVNFLEECLRSAKNVPDSLHIQKFIELRQADMIRLDGNLEESKQKFDGLQRQLFVDDIGLQEAHRKQLEIFFFRYYGRCLKDISGKQIRHLNESINLLERAIEGFKDQSVFVDQDRNKKDLAVTYFDLGNTLVLLSEKSETNKVVNMRKAKANFEKTKHIFMEYDKATTRLFDVYLSLASCDMELMSWQLSPDGTEDSTTLSPALEHYDNAEKIAKDERNGVVIKEDPVRMGNLFYGRAVCLYRAKNFEAAVPNAINALKMRKQVFGTHNKTMNCYMLLGNIYSSSFGIRRRLERTFKCYVHALNMAAKLKRRKRHISSSDLDRLEFHLDIMCHRMNKDFEEYGKKIENLRGNASDDRGSENESSDSDESDDTDHPTAAELKSAFDGNISDPDDEGRNAPTCAEARKLSTKLKDLMNRQAERISANYDELAITDMEILVGILVSGYPNMDDEKRNVRYEKGIKLYHELTQLENSPASFLKQREIKSLECPCDHSPRVNLLQRTADVPPLSRLRLLWERYRFEKFLIVVIFFVIIVFVLILG